ncbi:MAG: HAMP domain-containing histidine kinase [Bryobacterales bacterium]|nr:HAMP domain-containing histidine kinase [Bryobacterales bacterium]MBV9401363.1 HAMP domain-containing histidine kinase [Bryobacterales bacterium]
MTPLREWLHRPAGTLLLIVFLLTAVSVTAVVWFGWKLYQQESLVQAQRSEERLEQAAGRIAANIRSALAENGERLGAWELAPAQLGPGELLVTIKDNTAMAAGTPLLYYPHRSREPEADPAIFADAELMEIAQKRPADALEAYRRLADSNKAAIRAGALLREARVLRNTGRAGESQIAYTRLAGMRGVTVAGSPADLVARIALGDPAVTQDLLRGHWHLTRGQFQFYWDATAHGQPAPADAIALAEAVSSVWEQRESITSSLRGQQTIWAEGKPFLVMWRGSPERRAILLSKPESFLKPQRDWKLVAALADTDGRIIAGERAASGRMVIRAPAETQLPWTLYTGLPQPIEDADLAASKRFLMLGTSAMVLFLVLGGYFIARVIRREAETVRMQSDFVSAVSHEFRSPLTSLRQLSEMLADGRIQSAERRQIYYETLVKETTRLQRLVEGLLNFGRMDAGVREYRFEEVDAAALVQRVVAEFDAQVAGQGRRIESRASTGPLHIEGDPEAICVAVRNLLDNALKYSPGQPVVWVGVGVKNGCVAISVRDKGPGITESERKAIFRRFVRGSAAKATNAKGSGVGLTMVRHIVAAHGGEVTVESEPGHGSEFTILLPPGRNSRHRDLPSSAAPGSVGAAGEELEWRAS